MTDGRGSLLPGRFLMDAEGDEGDPNPSARRSPERLIERLTM
jgi:hypothetical protein